MRTLCFLILAFLAPGVAAQTASQRELETRFVPYPRNAPFSVSISRGTLGEYRLRVEGAGRLVRIRRVQ